MGTRCKGRQAGKPFPDAILELARLTELCDPADLRNVVNGLRRAHAFVYSIPQAVHDKRGHKVGNLPGIPGDQDGGDEVLRRMHQHAAQLQDAVVTAAIEPARSQILADHPPSARDLGPIVTHSRFVPREREALYIRGLLAGLEGDFSEACHFLIPQVENSVRGVFATAGVHPFKHLRDNTQRQKDLNDLLTDDRASEILGDELAFTLRGLLIRASGSNLRNRFAHGLIDSGEFLADRYVYLWALVLRLVVAGALPAPRADPVSPGPNTNPE